MDRPRGDLFVLSAPSGAGKTTLIRRFLSEVGGMHFSVSSTTRPSRPGEVPGVDYRFVAPEEFDRMLAAGRFLEWAQVHGQRYGTSSEEVDAALARGEDVLLDVDSQGAASVRRLRPGAVLIFVLPPGRRALRDRLARRGAEDPAEMERRLQAAAGELAALDMYDYCVVNDSLERALKDLQAIVRARRLLRARATDEVRRILTEFEDAVRAPAPSKEVT